MVISHRIKKTTFLSRPVSVILQNENGPCPLIALANVLILQGSLHVHPDRSEITSEQLTEMIGTCLIDKNPPLDDEDMRKNQQKTLDDIMSILPTLENGLDVNVKFDKVTSFEYDARVSVFDMLGVSLYHGWVADPNDEETFRVVSKYSYNQLVDRIIMADAIETKMESKKQKNEEQKDEEEYDEVEDNEAVTEDKERDEQGKLEERIEEEMKMVGKEVQENEDEVKDNQEPESGRLDEEVKEELEALKEEIEEENSLDEEELASLKKEAAIAKGFLEETATQLTYLGLTCLHSEVGERKLCVFFRNNHFSTMFRVDGELYLLLTDQGYEKQNAVAWERLNEINGDTEIVSPEFSNPNEYTFMAEDLHDGNSDHQLALQLQQEETERAARTNERNDGGQSAQSNQAFIEEQRRALAQYKKEQARNKKNSRTNNRKSKSPDKTGNCTVS